MYNAPGPTGFTHKYLSDNDETLVQETRDMVNAHPIHVDEKDVLELLQIKRRFLKEFPWGQPTVEVIGQHRMIANFFDTEGVFLYDEWKKHYDAGFTTIITNVLDLTSELRDLDKKIFSYVGRHINGNFYFTKGSTKNRVSFDLHNHEHHVIVKPIYGKSSWICGGRDFVCDKEAFIIDKEEFHCVYKCTEPKLSLTLSLS